MQWWGHSKEHGWVVLDRSLPTNRPGLKENLVFFRCRDSVTFVEKRKNWSPPLYHYAPNYLRDLSPEASTLAREEFQALCLLWPEYERKIQLEHGVTEEQVEAERLGSLKQKKAAAARKKTDASEDD